MPKISVIIPVYNGEKTIQETINSVLKQTFFDFELIIINDGSQDATLEKASDISDPRIKLFSYPNQGLAASRNRGMALASGEFISFLDADDLWTPEKLEAQLNALQNNPQAVLAYSWTDYIDEQGQFLYSGKRPTATDEAYTQLLVSDFLENGSNALIRRQALMKIGSSFDETLTAGEDWDMWLRLAAHQSFAVVRSPQILYRVSTTSMSVNVARQETECLKVIERAFAQAPQSLQHLKKQSLSHLYTYLLFKCLEGSPSRDKGLSAARCLWHAINHDRSILQRRSRLMSIVALKILLTVLLPQQQVQTILSRLKNLSQRPLTRKT